MTHRKPVTAALKPRLKVPHERDNAHMSVTGCVSQQQGGREIFDLEEAKRVCADAARSEIDDRAYVVFACNHFKEAVAEIARLSDQRERIGRLLEVHEMIGGETGLLAVIIRRIFEEREICQPLRPKGQSL